MPPDVPLHTEHACPAFKAWEPLAFTWGIMTLGWKRAIRRSTAYRACMLCLQGTWAVDIHIGDYEPYDHIHIISSMGLSNYKGCWPGSTAEALLKLQL